MVDAAPGRLTRRARRLSPRAAVRTGAGLMVAGQAIFAVLPLTGAALPALDASALVVVPVILAGAVMLWFGPVVVALAAGQPGWIGAMALPGGYVVWILGTLGTISLADGAVLTVVEGALPVFSVAGALAVVGGGRVWTRLAGVAAIAGLAGALSYQFQAPPPVTYLGVVVAFGFLVWVAPHTRPTRTSASPDATASLPPGGR